MIQKKEDVTISAKYYRKAGLLVAQYLSQKGVTPNQVTLWALLNSLTAALLISTGFHFLMIVGAVFIQLAIIWDLVDGGVANIQGSGSRLGSWLDSLVGEIGSLSYTLALAIASYNQIGNVFPLFMLISVLLARYLFTVSLMMLSTRVFICDRRALTHEIMEPILYFMMRPIRACLSIFGRKRKGTASEQGSEDLPVFWIVDNIFFVVAVLNQPLVGLWALFFFYLVSFLAILTVTFSKRKSLPNS